MAQRPGCLGEDARRSPRLEGQESMFEGPKGSFESRTGCVGIGESVACEWESSEEGAECPNYWDRLL